MRNILTAIVLLMGVTCFAQVTPQYYIERYPNGVVAPIFNWGVGSDSEVNQFLLLLDSFNTGRPPVGRIKNIYLRTGKIGGNEPLWKGCGATKVNLSLGYSSLKNLDTILKLFSGLTLLAQVDTLRTDTVGGGWIKIPVKPEITFYTDSVQNLLFQFNLDTGGIHRLPQGSGGGCFYLASRFMYAGSPMYYLRGHKTNVNTALRYPHFADFGFDLYPNPADVEATQNVTDLRIYPNPSSGRFIISMAATGVVRDARLSVNDVSGRVVWQQHYKNIDDNFYQNLDLSQYPKGIYVAELRADGERITRKLVLQ